MRKGGLLSPFALRLSLLSLGWVSPYRDLPKADKGLPEMWVTAALLQGHRID